jgi:flagellar export protein FliJ
VAARFRFRLESLLKLRRSLEQAAQRALARTLERREAAREHLERLRQAGVETVESRSVPAGQPVDLERWRAAERYLVVLERQIREAGEQLREAEARVVTARQELVRAHRAHLMLVRLKERRQELHALEMLREEAREMDEMAVLRYRHGPVLTGGGAREVSP